MLEVIFSKSLIGATMQDGGKREKRAGLEILLIIDVWIHTRMFKHHFTFLVFKINNKTRIDMFNK